MELWLLWAIAGTILLILEMFLPTFFLLSLSIGAFAAALLSYYEIGLLYQAIVFGLFSIILIAFIRPLFMTQSESTVTNIDRYKNQTAKVIKEINPDEHTGRIRIFDEEWNATSGNGEIITEGSIVVIEKIENMTAYVKTKEN